MRRLVPVALLTAFVLVAPAAADDAPAAKRPAVAAAQRPAAAADAATRAAAEAEAKKRAVLAQPAPRSLREARRRLAAIRVDVDFRDMPLTDAVEFIGTLAGFNVIVGPELQKDGPPSRCRTASSRSRRPRPRAESPCSASTRSAS